MFIVVNKVFQTPVFDENGDKVYNEKGELTIDYIKTDQEYIDIDDIINFRKWKLTAEEKKHIDKEKDIIVVMIKDRLGGSKKMKILESIEHFNNRVNEIKKRLGGGDIQENIKSGDKDVNEIKEDGKKNN